MPSTYCTVPLVISQANPWPFREIFQLEVAIICLFHVLQNDYGELPASANRQYQSPATGSKLLAECLGLH